ncbi:hypothetical protein LTR37_013083 [Vermiconidia calcicola]|uniref:Uncharacterized protein n=1 Tax=Vermiconidia calcicola TaxID=1690605 RepID=A0ACC3MYH7_9PEZI|nr:hypothetical protein LTR37_013083 [Vermiconidia calcicola]
MSVTATGAQGYQDRFGIRRRFDYDTPPISQWRCNLTALSQLHNLYFVAYAHNIYVYVPQFATQAIPENPVLIFTSQPSSPRLTGYVGQRSPHSINSIITQYLGNEEVVAVVRDDGDVDAFLVRHVVQAIERRAELGSSIDVLGDELRPFFQSNVGISAWGLAIHSEARILATSSNAHEVRVFKFGLLQTDDADSPLPDEDTLDVTSTQNNGSRQRATDVTHQVLNGETNIPYISFCNTGDDPEARWLLTTDISGVCRTMDLHSLQPVQAFRFGRSFAGPQSGGFDRLNAGWGVMFLDRRSFQPAQSVYDVLGMGEDEELPGIRRSAGIWDLSRTVRHLRESKEPFVYRRPETQVPTGRSSRLRRDGDESPGIDASAGSASSASLDSVNMTSDHVDATSSLGEGALEQEFESDSSDGGARLDVEIEMSQGDEEEGQIEVEIDNEPETTEEDTHQTSTAPGAWVTDPETDSDIDSTELIDDGEDPEDEGTEDSVSYTSFYNGQSICGNEPRFVHENVSLCEDLPCPILHASVRNIYLLQPSNKSYALGPNLKPMLGFANPLRQTIQQDFEYLRVFERLNMHAYIPPLGIVVLASQKGRAVVLQLTKLPKGSYIPPEMQPVAQDKWTRYCMRLAAILPFAHQEKANQRPFAPLHGIAAGPMQGSENVKLEQKRWRLMLMYQDHSVLSYEIGRAGKGSAGARDSGLDVGVLVV